MLRRRWRSFEESRAYARSLNLRNWHEWMQTPRPEDIPSEPFKIYKDQWKGWRDWLGTAWRPFEEARAFVRALSIKSIKEWRDYCNSGQKPRDIPAYPQSVYKGVYKGMSDWLGTEWLSFEEARDYIHSLQIRGQVDWRKFCKSGSKPHNIPSAPDTVYKNRGWINWADWLGTREVHAPALEEEFSTIR